MNNLVILSNTNSELNTYKTHLSTNNFNFKEVMVTKVYLTLITTKIIRCY